MRRFFPRLFTTLSLTLALFARESAFSQDKTSTPVTRDNRDALEKQFQKPPAETHPWVFWVWLSVDTTPAAITADLEEMHAKGIEGAILYEAGAGSLRGAPSTMELVDKGFQEVRTDHFPGAHSTQIPGAPMPPWTPHSREMYRFAAREAARLGVKLTVSVGLAGTSGAIPPECGQQKLVWSETAVAGPQTFDSNLPVPDKNVPATMVPAGQMMASASFAGADNSQHPVAVLAVPVQDGVSAGQVINLSGKVDAAGRLRWDVPTGQWTILRFAYTPTGARNGWGLYTDAMSAEALDKTWDVTMGQLIKEMKPDERKGLIGVEDDSWESGNTTWTSQFAAQFQQLRHYDLIPWLPVLAGKKIGEPGAADGVKRDYYRTIADLIATNHYAHLRALAHRNGLTCFSEPAGPNSAQLDTMLNCKEIDMPMAEFWMPSAHRPTPASRFLLRNAASANHIYGHNVTACESFTSLGPFWEESLFDIKNVADQAFCDGCNLNVIHNYSHSPSVSAKPGYTYFAGTFYNRNVTWWEQTPAFNDYLARCSYLLQQGHFVADALYYRGDDIGHGEPMKTRPALPAEGYDHDNCNLDALLTRAGTRDGRIVMPDGMSYRILVLPANTPMAPEALDKIAALVKAGATVVGPRPSGAAGLAVAPDAKAKFDSETDALWGNGGQSSGHVIANATPAQVLADLHIAPDFEYNGLSGKGEIDWIHRTAAGADIYFVASRWDPLERVNCTFRVAGRQPELWNPVTGEIRDAPAFRQAGGRTIVPLEFDPRGSVFVIFRKPIAPNAQGVASSNYPAMKRLGEIPAPWEVSFDPKWGGPANITFDTLVDWTNRSEDGIKHYSGTAIYRKAFVLNTLPSAQEKLFLDLGEVHEEASVKLNGRDLGIIWARPARIDITGAARTGKNELEITVVNLWPNRMIGDASLPADQPHYTETNMLKFSAATPLFPSGLLGPVTLQAAAQ
jgi:hypothetical protein